MKATAVSTTTHTDDAVDAAAEADAEKQRLRFFTAVCTQSRSNAKRRGIAHSITADNLLAMWHAQDGKCYYTGRTLELVRGGGTIEETCNHVGIERVRSHRGYFPTNVRLVCKAANYMKNALSRAEFFKLCRDVCETWPRASSA